MTTVGVTTVARAQDPGQTAGDTQAQAEAAAADPGAACADATNQTAGCDNKYTPIAKDGGGIGWTQVAGAVHPAGTKPAGYDITTQNQIAPIPPTVDFYTVSFANPSRGFAGGAQCREDAPPPNPGETEAVYMERITPFLNTCVRVPVIYRYTDFTEKGPIWEEAYKGDEPGFVGAITWLRNLDVKTRGQRVLAVGGTGSPNENCPKSETNPPYPTEANPTCGGFPRREPAIPDDVTDSADSNCSEEGAEGAEVAKVDPDEPPTTNLQRIVDGDFGPASAPYDPQRAQFDCEARWRREHDPAGKARAWVFSSGRWLDLTGSIRQQHPEMGGLTAADAALDVGNCPTALRECAMAGGLQQIWMWRDGEFDSKPWKSVNTSTSPSRPVTYSACGGRITASAAACGWHYRVRAIQSSGQSAITGGCCTNVPNLIARVGRTVTYSRTSGAWSFGQINGLECILHTLMPCGPRRLPDSYYARDGSSLLASPGGPERPGEPASQIGADSLGANARDAVSHYLSSARLVAGAGDAQTHQQTLIDEATDTSPGSTPASDDLIDWAVGGLKGRGRGVAYTTTTQTYGLGSMAGIQNPHVPLVCPPGTITIDPNPENLPECKPDDAAIEKTKSGYLFALSSYFLNGYGLAGNSGTGWAVGDRGGIVRLGGSEASAGGTLRPEQAPKLGRPRITPPPAREPYDSHAPATGSSVAGVPSLEAAGFKTLPAPELVPYGTANAHAGAFGGEQVKEVVMSRDGTEGWAVGPRSAHSSAGPTTLYRFDGSRWRRCSTDSLEGVFEADPACEALWPLRHFGSGVKITAIARIPHENGSDPTRADEPELVAAGTEDATRRIPILRYRDGRWSVDEDWTHQLSPPAANGTFDQPGTITDFGFTGPEDGWIAAGGNIFRLVNGQWIKCGISLGSPSFGSVPGRVDRQMCEDSNSFIPAMEDLNREFPIQLTTAGERVFLYTNRQVGTGVTMPMLLYKDPGRCDQPGDPGCWQQAYDPGCVRQDGSQNDNRTGCIADTDRSKQGAIQSVSVAIGEDGSYNGWGIGWFGSDAPRVVGNALRVQRGSKETPLIRTDPTRPEGTRWQPAAVGDAALEYLLPPKSTHASGVGPIGQVAALPGRDGNGAVFANRGPTTVRLDPADGAWRVLETPYAQVAGGSDLCQQAGLSAMAPDNQGGLWLVAQPGCGEGEDWFYRYSDRAPREPFTERAHPIREFITSAAGGGDGSVWVATSVNVVYRYDRLTGWDRMTIAGWDPGRVITNPSPVNAIAIGADGNGVAVGRHGRIARIGPAGTVLDPAAGVLCSKQSPMTPPCGTGRDLRAAAVAPDGSAMVAGDSRAILYRSGTNGFFQAINPPPTAVYATITAVSLPSADSAWVVTELGEIFKGTLGGAGWTWTREDTDEFGDSIARSELRRASGEPLSSIAVDADGQGYAVGDNGTILERVGDGPLGWRRLDAGVLDHLRQVTLSADGHRAVIAGDDGLILTLADGRFEPARHSHRFDPVNWGTHSIPVRPAGAALLAGPDDGQVEAWVAMQSPSRPGFNRSPEPGMMLHYSNAPSEPLLDGHASRTDALADTAGMPQGSIDFAAFGNSNCQHAFAGLIPNCPELTGSNEAHDLVATGIRDELLDRRESATGPDLALFTGDVGDAPGRRALPGRTGVTLAGPHDNSPIHDRWREIIAEPLNQGGVPLFGAIGGRDLFLAGQCDPLNGDFWCLSSWQTRSGANTQWRQAMATMPAPWGARGAPPASTGEISFEPVDAGGTKFEFEDQRVDDPTKAAAGTTVEDPSEEFGGTETPDPTGNNLGREVPRSGIIGDQRVPEEGLAGPQKIPAGGAHTHYAFDVVRDGEPLVRVVVLDTSPKSLAAADAQQNPLEQQLPWLRNALQRPQGQRAIVLTNTPTYSYGPGTNGETLAEGALLESVLMENQVDLVVDGRLGWNALYYALAPGLHWPCPGDTYKAGPPPAVPDCHGFGGSQSGATASDALPFLVAHTAGGKFGPEGHSDGSAEDGFWHGYSMVHLDPETGRIEIEQRPIFDWIGIEPESSNDATHTMRPHKRIELVGYGREPLAIDVGPRYDEISSPAITHRFELLLADPDKPWLPKEDEGSSDINSEYRSPASERLGEEDPCGPYLCLDPAIGRIDDQSGQVRAGNGNYERTYAIAQLSVGRMSATYPLVFEPRSAFRTPTPVPPRPSLQPPPAPPSQPPPQNAPTVEPPQPPSIPPIEQPLSINPVIPPAPPAYGNASPIDLGVAPVAIVAPPPTVVLQPPNPVVQPAPPSGARREARQRQAATQKSGADAVDDASANAEDAVGDLADSPRAPEGAQMTRHEFTAIARQEPVSAWARDALIGGGLGIAALVLALGLSGARPTPRRRPPEVPAPARSYARNHRA